MIPNRYENSRDFSNERISELKQTYLAKQMQVYSIERKANLKLLNDDQKLKSANSPKSTSDRSSLLEEARRRQKERALLKEPDHKVPKNYIDETEEKEPALSFSRFSEERSSRYFVDHDYSISESKTNPLFNKDTTQNNLIPRFEDSNEFKLCIDQEYLQLKQELENLRKIPRTIEKPQAKSTKTSFLSKSYIKDTPIEVKWKEKPTRDIENQEVNYVVTKPQHENEKITKPVLNIPKKSSEELIKPSSKPKCFKVESSRIDIIPETSRKSPINPGRKSIEADNTKSTIKRSETSDATLSYHQSTLNIAQVEPINIPNHSYETPLNGISTMYSARVLPTMGNWNLEPQYPPPPMNGWNSNYSHYNSCYYPPAQMYMSGMYYHQPPVAYNYPYPYADNRYQYTNTYTPPPQYYSTQSYPERNDFTNNSGYQQNEDFTKRKTINYDTSKQEIFDKEKDIVKNKYKINDDEILEAEEIVKPAPKIIRSKDKPVKSVDNVVMRRRSSEGIEEIIKNPLRKKEKYREDVEEEDSWPEVNINPDDFKDSNLYEDKNENLVQIDEYIPKTKAKTLSKIQTPQALEVPEQPVISKKPVLIEFGTGAKKSLAELFKQKNKKLIRNMGSRDNNLPRQDHKEKTKEELIEIRKNMVKAPKLEKKPEVIQIKLEDKKNNNKEPCAALMERLATGQRVRVSKEEMLKLNKKNYQQLPEVKKKQEDELKRLEKQQRIQKARDYERCRSTQTRRERKFQYNMDY
ncbi:hypothetical protein SteCoe_10163 [Stentor coeruleus]|uniref:ALMS motif domain-containing protein n=1 Tax=Stentor coeruleus TaxID=5963 RepID=A0A1R2CG64_9CILI|nr:hypothetical protein SteCoe_10163 [Stentor coeruleus]